MNTTSERIAGDDTPFCSNREQNNVQTPVLGVHTPVLEVQTPVLEDITQNQEDGCLLQEERLHHWGALLGDCPD